jgi:zinc protease
MSPGVLPAAGAAPIPTPIPILPPGVRVATLDNGLTIIVREDRCAPVVAAQAWCQSGSVHEGRWLGAGLSHVLEHMLFKGTTTRGPGRIDQEVQEAGGYMNAFTSFDRTVYWINVPNTGGRVAIDILCDIMQHAALPDDELAREMDVIRREMDMNQDDPARRASRRLFETAYTQSPYRLTIIGYPDIFNELRPDDIRSYYRERYAPNNVFFVVAGDVRAGDVIEQITQAYSSSKARPLPPMVLPEEPPQAAPRETIEEAAIELGHLHLAWHIPGVRHPDVPLLDILATLLGSGRSSRLYQQVRERQGLVHSVDAWTYCPGNPGLWGASAIVDPHQLEPARDAILAQVERLRAGDVEPGELAKAVKQFTASTLASRKTMQGQAQDLGGNWIAARDLNFSERYLAAVKRATLHDLRRVARDYLTAENRTVYALMPAGTAPSRNTSAVEVADHAVQRRVLDNGLRLLVKTDSRLPFVECRAVWRGGVLGETPATSGVTQLLSRLLVKGTATRTAEQLAAEIESVGGSLESYGGNNTYGVNVEVLSPDTDLALDILAEVVLAPAFPAEALERERQVQLASIKAQNDQILQGAFRLMRRALFGERAYGLDQLGSEESVARLQVADLRAFHDRLTRPDNCVLAIFGDITQERAEAAVRARFGAWTPAAQPLTPPDAPTWGGPAHLLETRDKQQAVVVAGFAGVSVTDPDRYALDLIQEACSDLGSRLYLRVRERLGLAYYVGAQHFVGVAPGYFAFYAGTRADAASRVEAELRQETLSLARDGLTEAELARAKAKVVGQKKIARQDLGGFALSSALDELYGLGYDHTEHEDALYDAVTVERTRAVAARYLDPARWISVIMQPDPAQGAAAGAAAAAEPDGARP